MASAIPTASDSETGPPQAGRRFDPPRARQQLLLAGALAIAVSLLAFLALPVSHKPPPKPIPHATLFATVNEGTPVAVSRAELIALAAHLKFPVYWAGPQPGHTLKLRTNRVGSAILLYLTAGTPLSTTVQTWLTVATDPYESNPYAYLLREATRRGYGHRRMPNGQFVLTVPNGREAYFASPHSHLMVEVYDPSKGVALREVLSGRVRPAR